MTREEALRALAASRKAIDALDLQLLELLNQRTRAVEEIGRGAEEAPEDPSGDDAPIFAGEFVQAAIVRRACSVTYRHCSRPSPSCSRTADWMIRPKNFRECTSCAASSPFS